MKIEPLHGSAAKLDADRDPQKIRKAAGDFEALLIGQLLATMQDSMKDGALDGDASGAGSTMFDFAQEHLSKVIAKNGGFGLAKIVSDGLTPRTSVEPEKISRFLR